MSQKLNWIPDKGGLQTSPTRDEDRQLVIVSKPENDFEEVFAILIEPYWWESEMGGANAHGVAAVQFAREAPTRPLCDRSWWWRVQS